MCSSRNGLGGKLVISTAPGLRCLWIGLGDSDRVAPVIHVGSTGWLRKGNGGSSRCVRSGSETVGLVL
jgi:hypothetical protein